jgi:TRAP transporter TAXI family solute receptor
MSQTRSGYIFTVSVAILAALFAFSTIAPGYAAERKSIRLGTSQAGTYGYKVAAQLVPLLESALGGEYTITVNPYQSPTVAMKALMNGDGEMSYTADVGMTEFYNGEGGFKGYTPTKPKIVHTWYAYPMESFMMVSASKGHLYKSLADFSGKPVFYTPAGFMNWLNFVRTFKALGYQFKHVEIGVAAQGDALQAGSIIGAVAYTTAGASLPAYWRETELRVELKAINPSPDEVKKLTAAGLAPLEVDPKKAFSKDVGVKTILGVPLLFGFNVRADMPEEIVYKMLNALFNKREELLKSDPGFAPLASDFTGMQARGINANPTVPVHPGLAKFMKEKKAWNEKWIISSGK